jgi:hypothetical protein
VLEQKSEHKSEHLHFQIMPMLAQGKKSEQNVNNWLGSSTPSSAGTKPSIRAHFEIAKFANLSLFFLPKICN